MPKCLFPAVIYLITASGVLSAMPDDRNQIMVFSAKSADFNQQTHQGEYREQVQLDQGTTHLRAHRAITHTDEKNRLTLAIAYGTPDTQVHFWTQTARDKPLLHAYADTLQYNPAKHWIELTGQARIQQGQDSVSAPVICYDTLKHRLVTNSDKNTRTVFLIHPEKKP